MAEDDILRSGRQLYALLPAIYRTRDGAEVEGRRDLERYLDAFGVILDGLRALLDQQLADAFPDDDPSPQAGAAGRLAQDWVLPYLGALVDARPVSIDPRGQRAEVASAVRWRQRKGTMKAAEELTEEVALVSAVIQEGWQRIAVTARIDGRRNRPVTVDTRLVGHAVISSIDEPGADFTRFEGLELPWRVADASGVPVTTHGYQDASLRTVDTRAPSGDRLRGLYHPRRLLAWVAPEDTLLPLPPRRLSWAQFVGYEQGLRLRTGDSREFVCAYRGDVEIVIPEGEALVLDDDQPYVIEGLRLAGKVVVSRATLVVRQCGLQALEVRSSSLIEPALAAHGCSFTAIVASTGKVVLDACTVRGPLVCRALQAQRCIFTGLMAGASDGSTPIEVAEVEGSWRAEDGIARFLVEDPTHPAGAVLHPNSPRDLIRGSDGRELGRYRHGRPFPVVVGDDVDLQPLPAAARAADQAPYELCDLVLHGRVRMKAGVVGLRRVVVRTFGVAARGAEVRASGCIFDTLALGEPSASSTSPTTLELEYCTVMALTGRARLRMSDCIVVASPADAATEEGACLRWSSLPQSWPLDGHERCVHGLPCFLSDSIHERLYGLPSPTSSASIRSGAEDGGELGAYHDMHWLQRLAGVEEKLLDHVPIGITPVLVPDPTLVNAPPRSSAIEPNDERE
jgi:hypothetical protein